MSSGGEYPAVAAWRVGWHPDVIELQLAHAERNKVRAAYNRAQRLVERRTMMQAWADYLDELTAYGGAVASSSAQASSPNGAGKTTFARQYLPGIARVVHFVNADLIAGGLSPLKPELAAIAAARMVLREIDRLATERLDFAFETTLSGRTYVRQLELWKRAGYRIEIIFLCLGSVDLALRRIDARVRQGGHDVPKRDVIRRFKRGWENFQKTYQPMEGKLGGVRQFRGVAAATEEEKMKIRTRPKRPESFAAGVGRGLRQGGTEDGADVRDPDLHHREWEGRREAALIFPLPADAFEGSCA